MKKKFFSFVLLGSLIFGSSSVYAENIQSETNNLNNIAVDMQDVKVPAPPVTSIKMGTPQLQGRDLVVDITVMGQGRSEFIELDGYKEGTLIKTEYIGRNPVRGYKFTYKFKDVDSGYHTLKFRTLCSATGQWKYYNDSFFVN